MPHHRPDPVRSARTDHSTALGDDHGRCSSAQLPAITLRDYLDGDRPTESPPELPRCGSGGDLAHRGAHDREVVGYGEVGSRFSRHGFRPSVVRHPAQPRDTHVSIDASSDDVRTDHGPAGHDDSTPADPRACRACPHALDAHDGLGTRFCAATTAAGHSRGCICSAGTPRAR